MSDEIFSKTQSLEFRQIYGFTFVFLTTFNSVMGKVSSAEITPVGIIYDENGEYYFAPLKDNIKAEKVVEEFVENYKLK